MYVYKVVLITTCCLEEALKEKEKPKDEEREKPKDAAGLECKPRPLHKTCSLFMRNIAPNISRAEIISVSGDVSLGGRVGVCPRSFRWQRAFGMGALGQCALWFLGAGLSFLGDEGHLFRVLNWRGGRGGSRVPMWLFSSLDSFDSCSFVNDTQALCGWHYQSPSQRGGKKLGTLGWR